MDAKRFDSLARTLTDARSRRGTLASLLGGALGLLGLAEGEAAKSGACAPACLECNFCQNGKCKKKKGKKKCKKGICLPQPDGIACENNPCKTCQGGTCVNTANDTTCNGTGKCLNGICNPPPVCLQLLDACSELDPGACCSDVCTAVLLRCAAGAAGKECLENADCISNSCIGFRCQ